MIVRAVLERRILVNYRVDPDVLAAVVPAPFRPVVTGGYGVAGICLIRLGRIRPSGLPAIAPISSESAAHRIAVEWDSTTGPVRGVYIPRRDTSSRLTVLAGGRVFPGRHHLARFEVSEGGGRYRVRMVSADGRARICVGACLAGQAMPGSVLGGLDQAAQFFRRSPIGYSATPVPSVYDGVAFGCSGWDFRPLLVDELESSFFDDAGRFPTGTAALDSAFLMCGLDTTWQPLPKLRATASSGPGPGRPEASAAVG
ncbi:MAG TPA: DUF2071 domain-containing protein [Streptosporangiaceae bacterium]|nr:DUF2071 domain-containing protein [Streptosporangiaceae bacterium]